MVMLVILVGLLLVVVAATRPVVLSVSDFEISRRSKSGDLSKIDTLRAKHAETIKVILSLDTAVLLVLFVALAISQFDWVSGLIVSVALVLCYPFLASLGIFKKIAKWAYGYYEKYLLDFCEKFPKIAAWLNSFGSWRSEKVSTKAYSREEFSEILDSSKNIFSKNEFKLIKNALVFENKTVKSIMTPRSMIDSIPVDELLGPITLSDLHKTGHSRFPVIDKDIDHIVGMLYVRDLLVVDGTKNSSRVSDVMDKTVCFVHEDQTIDQALAAFLKTKKLLFVVINEFRETVGLLSLEDVLEALLGQKISDEFEKHSDLRAVAARNPRKNNSPNNPKDIG